MSGTKALFTISGCTVSPAGKVDVDKGAPSFTALINPSGYEYHYQIDYGENKVMGTAAPEAKFNAAKPESLHLKQLVLDGTGAVPGAKVPVKQQVDALIKAVYTYVGNEHETPIVQVVWGTLLFYGRLKSLKFDYTLFAPNGDPLRAKVTLDFVQYMSAAEAVKNMSKSSPDLTHLVQVRAGDTLPLLCERIYRNPAYYLEVARINGLHLFRQLEPGTSLRFPPLL